MNNENEITEKELHNFFYFNKPGLMVRIKSTFIDSVITVGLLFFVSEVFNSIEIKSGIIRAIPFMAAILYEPLFTAYGRTIGQKLMGIRVINYFKYQKTEEVKNINFFNALVRYFFKIALGWISLLSVHSDKYGRAIHDSLGNSVVINSK